MPAGPHLTWSQAGPGHVCAERGHPAGRPTSGRPEAAPSLTGSLSPLPCASPSAPLGVVPPQFLQDPDEEIDKIDRAGPSREDDQVGGPPRGGGGGAGPPAVSGSRALSAASRGRAVPAVRGPASAGLGFREGLCSSWCHVWKNQDGCGAAGPPLSALEETEPQAASPGPCAAGAGGGRGGLAVCGPAPWGRPLTPLSGAVMAVCVGSPTASPCACASGGLRASCCP